MHTLKTKLCCPYLGRNMMHRLDLMSQLMQYIHVDMLFIHAAAGYGKTMLMCQLSQMTMEQGGGSKWLTLDVDDNDPIHLFHYIYCAFYENDEKEIPVECVISEKTIYKFCQHLPQRDHKVLFFIDDLDQIQNSASLKILWWLYKYLPYNYHMVISSRVRPQWNMTKDILAGKIHIINEAQLSLKQRDAVMLVEFFNQHRFDESKIDIRLAKKLIEKTEGWITGIQLTQIYIQEQYQAASFIENLSGAHHQIVRYLSEQVFLQQDAVIQQFLMKISVLRKFTVAAVEALTGQTSAQEILNLLAQKGLFIHALDEQCSIYKIHRLFREFLNTRLKSEQATHEKHLHIQAAHWFQAQGDWMDAIYHAQCAEDQHLLLVLLTEVSRDLILEGRIYTFLELVKPFPEQLLIQNPSLLYDMIWSLIQTHQVALANHYLHIWYSADQHQTLLAHEDQLGLAPFVALLEDDLATASDLAEQNLQQLASTAYFSRAPLLGITALHKICQGDILQARKLMMQTRVMYLQGRNLYGVAMVDCMDAVCDYLMGHLSLAVEKFEQLGQSQEYLDLGIDDQNRWTVMNIMSSFKADIYYELNLLSDAHDALNDFKGGDHLAIPDMVILGYVAHIRLAQLNGKYKDLQKYSNQANLKAAQWSLPRLSETIFAYIQPLQMMQEGSAKRREIPKQADFTMLSFSHLLRGDDLMMLRYEIFYGDLNYAIQALENHLQQFKVYPLRQARIQLLLALAYAQNRDILRSYDTLKAATHVIRNTGAVRIVLDEHPMIWQLISQLQQEEIRQCTQKKQKVIYAEDQKLQEFLKDLILIYTQESPLAHPSNESIQTVVKPPVEALSKREIQILQNLSQGYTDAEIANLIFLSVNTVKWHLRNIYNKLMVRSRLEAVTQAKEQGYIS